MQLTAAWLGSGSVCSGTQSSSLSSRWPCAGNGTCSPTSMESFGAPGLAATASSSREKMSPASCAPAKAGRSDGSGFTSGRNSNETMRKPHLYTQMLEMEGSAAATQKQRRKSSATPAPPTNKQRRGCFEMTTACATLAILMPLFLSCLSASTTSECRASRQESFTHPQYSTRVSKTTGGYFTLAEHPASELQSLIRKHARFAPASAAATPQRGYVNTAGARCALGSLAFPNAPCRT